MKLHTLDRSIQLPLAIEEAWHFFSNPCNLLRLTPPTLHLQITSDVGPAIYPGAIITYTIRPFLGIPVNWVTEITHLREPILFVDEQRFGPYRLWHHEHHFRKIDGGVEMTDLVHYALPLGPLGRFLNRFMVRRELDTIFSFRSDYLTQEFGSLPDSKGSISRTGRSFP